MRIKFLLSITCTSPMQENFIYKKQGPSPISLVRATRIFSKAKTLKKKFDLSLAIGDNPIYPFWDAHGQAGINLKKNWGYNI